LAINRRETENIGNYTCYIDNSQCTKEKDALGEQKEMDSCDRKWVSLGVRKRERELLTTSSVGAGRGEQAEWAK